MRAASALALLRLSPPPPPPPLRRSGVYTLSWESRARMRIEGDRGNGVRGESGGLNRKGVGFCVFWHVCWDEEMNFSAIVSVF